MSLRRPFTRKRPTGRGSFSYARIVDHSGLVMFRLCRRDIRGALHFEQRAFALDVTDRRHIADWLCRTRHQLRDQVDEIDLSILGVTA